MQRTIEKLALGALMLLLAACAQREFTANELELLGTLTDLPELAPDNSNDYRDNARAIALGQRLFFDVHLSGLTTLVDPAGRHVPYGRTPVNEPVLISCASCHDLRRGGIDRTSLPNTVSIGAGWFDVNAPTVINAAYADLFFRNGRADSLWAVSAIALEGRHSMNGDRLAIAWHVFREHREEYSAAFEPSTMEAIELGGERVFPLHGKMGKVNEEGELECKPNDTTEPWGDAFDCMADGDRHRITRVLVNVSKAIAAYEYRLLSRTTSVAEHLAGGEPLSDAAVRGARLFVGKAACIDCHGTPLLSDGLFHNTGVPESQLAVKEADCLEDDGSCLALGRTYGQAYFCNTKRSYFRRDSEWSDRNDALQSAHYGCEPVAAERGAWRTPSLLGVARTAPYMHNGVYATLEDVVWHYDHGGTDSGAAPASKSPEIQPLGLDPEEVLDLVAFLEALDTEPLPDTLTASTSDATRNP